MSVTIGDFGDYQANFDSAIYRNSGCIDLLTVVSGETNSAKSYKMEFIPTLDESDTYTVCIKKFKGIHATMKSTTSITVRIRDTEHEWKYNDTLSVDEMCAKWLIEVLFKKRYEYVQALLTLPPRLLPFAIQTGDNHIITLVITVGKDERNAGNVKWWLSRFKNSVNEIKITSTKLKIELKDVPCLRDCKGMEITGKTDIDIDFIKSLSAKYFIYRGKTSNKFTEDQLKELCNYFIETDEFHAVCLQQGTKSDGAQFFKWFREKFGDHKAEDVGFYRYNKYYENFFYFNMSNSRTTLGTFKTLEQARTDPDEWPLLYAGEV